MQANNSPELNIRGYRLGKPEAKEIITDLVSAAQGIETAVHDATEDFLSLWGREGDESVWSSDFSRYIWTHVCGRYKTQTEKAYRVCDYARPDTYRSFTTSASVFERPQSWNREYELMVELENVEYYPLCDAIDNIVGLSAFVKKIIKDECEYIVKIPQSFKLTPNPEWEK